MLHLADGFWNIRGDFRVAKLLNVGTQMSLVRRPNGRFLLLDSYAADNDTLRAIRAQTDDGKRIDAVLNVHPFHTVHCEFAQDFVPHARLIGTRRHHLRSPELNWDPALIEDAATQDEFSDTLEFSIPAGIELIPDDESVHVGSIIARHRASRIVHVDDTLNAFDLPSLVEKIMSGPDLRFHPKLADGLEKRAGAADDYIAWAKRLGAAWRETPIVCAAHNSVLHLNNQDFAAAIDAALADSQKTLDKHRQQFG